MAEALRLLDYGHKLGVDGWTSSRRRVAARNAEEREHDLEMKNGRVQPSTGPPIGYKVGQ